MACLTAQNSSCSGTACAGEILGGKAGSNERVAHKIRSIAMERAGRDGYSRQRVEKIVRILQEGDVHPCTCVCLIVMDLA